jgi:hypothetical protein
MLRKFRIIGVTILALLSTRAAPAQEAPQSRPVLRLETGMHTAPIRAAAVDAAGQTLVTVSDDRTVCLAQTRGQRLAIATYYR